MIVDVSHLSEGGFWDVVSHSKTPPVASHSNARALRDHPRNLSDRQIRALAEKGGVAGVNFYQNFLGESGSCRIDEMVGHVRHMYRIGGEDFVAVGTDFDGFSERDGDFRYRGDATAIRGVKKVGIYLAAD